MDTNSRPTSALAPLPPRPFAERERPNSTDGYVPMQRLKSKTIQVDRRVSVIDSIKQVGTRAASALKPASLSESAQLDPKETVVFSATTLGDRMANVCHGLHKHGFVDSLFSDIIVYILGRQYHLHRLTLINNPYFAVRMLEVQGEKPSSKDGKYELFVDTHDPNVTHEALAVVFARIYGFFGDIVTSDNLKSLLATAYFFKDTDLCEMCADFIKTIRFTPANSLEYIQYSSSFDYGETNLLLLRHTLTYLCREAAVDPVLASETFPQLEFAWLARILQSDTFYIASEYGRFEFISQVLLKKFQTDAHATLKETINSMTTHVLTLNRLPPNSVKPLPASPPPEKDEQVVGTAAPAAPEAEAFVSPHEPNPSNVVFLGKLASPVSPPLPTTHLPADQIDAAVNLLAKGLIYAHIPLQEYALIRDQGAVPMFVFDRHFRIHHDLIRLVETTPKGIQKLGIAYHYNMRNVVMNEGKPASTFYELIMGQVYAHDLLEMPPFRFGVEFGGKVSGSAASASGAPLPAGEKSVTNPLLRVLKGSLGESLTSRGVPYAGSLWSVKMEKGTEGGLNTVEFSLQRKPGSKESTVCIDSRPEAKFWCRLVAYVCTPDGKVTDSYTFETTGVHFLGQGCRVGEPNAELFKELFVAIGSGSEGAAVSVRLAMLLGVL